MDIERIILLVGVVVVVIIGRFNRKAGGIFGLVFTAAILAWGLSLYQNGGAVGILGKPLSVTGFLVFVGVFFVFNVISIWMGWRSSRSTPKAS
ncbi:MAG: hypothetical protein WC889_06350 [Myxococcota bacterium]|jgi:disulfide bond formation protein DsbB